MSAVYQAFLHNQLIFAFEETIHNREYVAEAHIYPVAEYAKMAADVREMMENGETMDRHLKMQLAEAMAEDRDAYMQVLGGIG